MVTLDISNNRIFAEGIKAIAKALKDNAIMKELNVSRNSATWDGNKHGEMSGVVALANTIPTMGALVKFDISNNLLRAEGTKAVAEALKGNMSMTELNISSNNMSADSQGNPGKDMSGVMDIANAIPTMGALTNLDMSNNKIPQDQQANLKGICTSKGINLRL